MASPTQAGSPHPHNGSNTLNKLSCSRPLGKDRRKTGLAGMSELTNTQKAAQPQSRGSNAPIIDQDAQRPRHNYTYEEILAATQRRRSRPVKHSDSDDKRSHNKTSAT